MSSTVLQFEQFLELPFFVVGMKTDLSSPVAIAEFSKFVDIFNSIIFQNFKQFSWNSISSISFVCSNTSNCLLDITLQDVWLQVSDHTIVVIKNFFVSFFCVFLPPLLNIFCFCQVHTISVLYWAHPCMKCSFDISNFLEKTRKISLVFPILLFSSTSLHCLFRKAFLSLFAILWNSAFKWVYLSFSPLLLASLLCTVLCKASSDNHFAFLHFFFQRMVLIPAFCTMSQTSIHSSSGTLCIRSNPLNIFVTSIYNRQGFNLGPT